MEIFGFEITRKKDELRNIEVSTAPSFVPPVEDDGTPVIQQQQAVSYQVGHMVPTLIWKVVLRMRQVSLQDTVKYL